MRALLALSQHLQIALEMTIEGRVVQLHFSARFDRLSPAVCCVS